MTGEGLAKARVNVLINVAHLNATGHGEDMAAAAFDLLIAAATISGVPRGSLPADALGNSFGDAADLARQWYPGRFERAH